jgi:hypothetical protein
VAASDRTVLTVALRSRERAFLRGGRP